MTRTRFICTLIFFLVSVPTFAGSKPSIREKLVEKLVRRSETLNLEEALRLGDKYGSDLWFVIETLRTHESFRRDQDFKLGVEILKKLVERGDPEGKRLLGELYLSGVSSEPPYYPSLGQYVERDVSEGVRLLKEAQGDSPRAADIVKRLVQMEDSQEWIDPEASYISSLLLAEKEIRDQTEGKKAYQVLLKSALLGSTGAACYLARISLYPHLKQPLSEVEDWLYQENFREVVPVNYEMGLRWLAGLGPTLSEAKPIQIVHPKCSQLIEEMGDPIYLLFLWRLGQEQARSEIAQKLAKPGALVQTNSGSTLRLGDKGFNDAFIDEVAKERDLAHLVTPERVTWVKATLNDRIRQLANLVGSHLQSYEFKTNPDQVKAMIYDLAEKKRITVNGAEVDFSALTDAKAPVTYFEARRTYEVVINSFDE